MAGKSFEQKLTARIDSANSLLCVGLDPVLTKLPAGIDRSPAGVERFCRELIESTADLAAAFKPNLAFYLALGREGFGVLQNICRSIPDDIPIVLDAKVNDLGETAKAWAAAAFDELGVDALTVVPWMGEDALVPYLSREGKCIIILVKTSNPGSGDFQDLPLEGGEPLFLHVADRCQQWHDAYPASVGMVVGATYSQQLAQVRERCPDLTILLPGLGAQGGDAEASVAAGTDAKGRGLLCSASRSIMYASDSPDFAAAARSEADRLREQINAARGQGARTDRLDAEASARPTPAYERG